MSAAAELAALRQRRKEAVATAEDAREALELQGPCPEDGEAAATWAASGAELRRRYEEAAAEARRLGEELAEARPAAATEGEELARLAIRADLAALTRSLEQGRERHEAAIAGLACAGPRERAEAADTAGDRQAAVAHVRAAEAACEAAGAHGGCPFAGAPWCPRQRAREARARVLGNIRDGRIGKKEAKLLRGHFERGKARRPLDSAGFDAFRVAQALVRRVKDEIATKAGKVKLRGDETLVLLYGPTGRGKTVAACYLIAHLGGLYLESYDLASVGQNPRLPSREQLLEAPVLVIDQVGRQHAGSGYDALMLERLVHGREREERLTVLVGNYDDLAMFEADVEEAIASRVAGSGVQVRCLGDDARRSAKP